MFKSVAKGGDESGRKNRRGWGQNARCMKSGKSGKSGACVGALSYQHGMQFSKLSIFYANSLAFHNALRFALLLSIFPQPRPHFSRGRGAVGADRTYQPYQKAESEESSSSGHKK